MRITLPALSLALVLAACASPGPGGANDGWITLFDGTSTDAWRGFRQAELHDGWAIEYGVLTQGARLIDSTPLPT